MYVLKIDPENQFNQMLNNNDYNDSIDGTDNKMKILILLSNIYFYNPI